MAEDTESGLRTFIDLIFGPVLFKRQMTWAEIHARGLLSGVERKNMERIAESAEGGDVRLLQHFIGAGTRDPKEPSENLLGYLAGTIGKEDGTVYPDECSFPKKGRHSAGAARQYCGQRGKVDNCQVGIFAGYGSEKGSALLPPELYLPKSRFGEDHDTLRKQCGIPDVVKYRTYPEIATDILNGLLTDGRLPFRYVLADSKYGRDVNFRDFIAGNGLIYMVSIPGNERFIPDGSFPGSCTDGGSPSVKRRGRPRKGPRTHRADVIASATEPHAWRRFTIRAGARGPIVYDFPFKRVRSPRGTRTDDVLRLIAKRDPETGDIDYLPSNAPVDVSPFLLVSKTCERERIERMFRDCKQRPGMGHYETRKYVGWHRHMPFVTACHACLRSVPNGWEKKTSSCLSNSWSTCSVRSAEKESSP